MPLPRLVSGLLLVCATAAAQTPPPLPTQQPTGHSGLYPNTNTQWVTAASTPAAAITDTSTITPGQLIFYREMTWDATTSSWTPKGTGAWTQFISQGVRYQPTPLGLAGGAAGSPMGDLYYVGGPTGGNLWPNQYYEPIWQRDLGVNGYIRQLGANNIAVYNLFNTPSQTVETLSAAPNSPFVQPASGLIPTSTLLVDSLTPGRTGTAPVAGAQTLPEYPVTGSSATRSKNWAIDYTVYGPLRYQNTGPNEQYPPNPGFFPSGFYVKSNGVDTATPVKQPPPHYYHFNHDRFLDICWNCGLLDPTAANPSGPFVQTPNPVYVWLALGVGTEAFPRTGTTDASSPNYYPYWQDYYNSLAAWMAQSYGQHPAVIGFIITNETNNGNDGSYEYYNFINQLNATLKQYAPGKLTMVSFQDDLGSLTTKVNVPAPTKEHPHKTIAKYPFEIYQPDIYGWNLYSAPNASTDIIQLFSGNGGITVSGYLKPIIISEIGVPATMRYRSVTGVANSGNGEPYFAVPNGYADTYAKGSGVTRGLYTTTSVNPNGYVLGRSNPGILSMTTAQWTAFQKNGAADPTYGSYYASGLVVGLSDAAKGANPYQFLEEASSNTWQNLGFSTALTPVSTLFDQVTQQTLANADGAGTAVILWSWLNALNSFSVPTNGAAASGTNLLSGYMVFEFSDEWDKWTDATSSQATVQLAAGVQDFADKSITGWASPSLPISGGGFNTINLNTTWDEEWFGLMSCRSTGRSSTDPAITQYGWLNGGADTLTPRLTYYVVQSLFTGAVTPVTAPASLTTTAAKNARKPATAR